MQEALFRGGTLQLGRDGGESMVHPFCFFLCNRQERPDSDFRSTQPICPKPRTYNARLQLFLFGVHEL